MSVSVRLFDCLLHAPDSPAELFIVEGESAAEAVCAIRSPRLQAVLPLQGKPMNALRVSPGRLRSSPWLSELTQALGESPGTALPFSKLRFQRVLLLLDPDADGIHAGALLQIFFHQCMRTLVEDGRVEIVHAPWGEIRQRGHEPLLSFHAAEFQQQCRALEIRGEAAERIRHRGLGTITPAILERTCVNPATRRSRVLSIADTEQAVSVFGTERPIGSIKAQ
jgi:DNA gyrase subunit B